MVFNKSDYDTMLQIVPSAGFSPPSSSDFSVDYSVDNFDLSLLPGGMDNEISFSTNTNNVQQFLSLYYDINSPPPLFPVYDNTAVKDITDNLIKDVTRYENSIKKTESTSFSSKGNTWNVKGTTEDFFNKVLNDTREENINVNKNTFLDIEMAEWDCKNDWDNIRVQSSIPSVTSSSNCSSPDFQLCPPTPPNFDNLIPLDDIKQEITLNLQNLLNDDRIENASLEKTNFEKKPELLRSILEKSPLNKPKHTSDKPKTLNDNHKLLREVLKDTSFQKKYNLRPFDIAGLGTGYQTEIKTEDGKSTLKEDVCDVNLAEGIIAPMLSKAIEQLMQDVDNTCIMLGIPRDPKKWSIEDVRGWLLWNSRQYNLPITMDLFNITGVVLTSMSEQDFQQRAPQNSVVQRHSVSHCFYREVVALANLGYDRSWRMNKRSVGIKLDVNDAVVDNKNSNIKKSQQTSNFHRTIISIDLP